MAVPTIQRQKQRNKRFFEDLGEGHRLEMVLVPGGSFTMGSSDDEEGREDSEGPQHSVTVPTFLMGRYPVTQAQWRRVAQFEPVERDLDPSPSQFRDQQDSDLRPVEQVSWYEAKEFCVRLSRFVEQRPGTQRVYRLPTEAEWEYACRAGTTIPFSCGETISTDIANYDGNYSYGRGVKGEFRNETTPVDYFQLGNPWGLCDMHGNVYEWCLDHWHDNYENAPTNGRAWITDGPDSDLVIRGGSWNNDPRYCRSAFRYHYFPAFQDDILGFRVVLAPR